MKAIFNYILLASCIILLGSCEKQLATEPRQSISADIALTSATGVNALLNAVYVNGRGQATNGVIYPEVLADNLINTTNNNNTFRNQELNNTGFGTGAWATNYTAINYCNLIIDAVNSATIGDITPERATQYKAEATFFRAWNYLQLALSYGYIPGKEVLGFNLGVPLILAPTRSVSDVVYPARATNAEVWAQIKTDLVEAAAQLTNTARTEKAYVSKAAAQALLSRVYLFTDDWTSTISSATETLAATSINGRPTRVETTGAGLVAHWRTYKDKSESIFEWSFVATDNLTTASLQSWFTIFPKPVNNTCNGNPTRASFADLFIPTTLLSRYAATDIRRTQLIEGPYCKLGQTNLYFTNKFSGTGGSFGLDNISMIRTSEVLLNRAEAYARTNQLSEALTDVNVIRVRAGLPALAALSQADLITAILEERRLELAFEGFRWHDLNRLQAEVTKAPGGVASGVVTYTDFRRLTNIPTDQIDVNKNLVQNPGY